MVKPFIYLGQPGNCAGSKLAACRRVPVAASTSTLEESRELVVEFKLTLILKISGLNNTQVISMVPNHILQAQSLFYSSINNVRSNIM
jgi:hypothetical protein